MPLSVHCVVSYWLLCSFVLKKRFICLGQLSPVALASKPLFAVCLKRNIKKLSISAYKLFIPLSPIVCNYFLLNGMFLPSPKALICRLRRFGVFMVCNYLKGIGAPITAVICVFK